MALATASGSSITARACAVRRVAAFALTSTMAGWFLSLMCDSISSTYLVHFDFGFAGRVQTGAQLRIAIVAFFPGPTNQLAQLFVRRAGAQRSAQIQPR